MWVFIHKIASPRTCYQWSGKILPGLIACLLLTAVYGLLGGLWLAPVDYQQGEVYRIMYIHVPSAIWSLGTYVIMAVSALLFLVWKIKVADLVAKLCAPIGAAFTFLALITGSIWGKPTWGTWWIWDARLTSELILLFIYGGIMALRSAIPEKQLAAQITSILILVGLINIPIVHFSVNWWQTLHQGASILRLGAPTIAPAMLYPLLSMIAAFFFYILVILTIGLRYELLQREHHTRWVQELFI
ncbi:MAG: heme ABC transporter permease [Proteobacteria bacterium]|nr:heme ABC transporter permease [Pseudomonadota bacterium]